MFLVFLGRPVAMAMAAPLGIMAVALSLRLLVLRLVAVPVPIVPMTPLPVLVRQWHLMLLLLCPQLTTQLEPTSKSPSPPRQSRLLPLSATRWLWSGLLARTAVALAKAPPTPTARFLFRRTPSRAPPLKVVPPRAILESLRLVRWTLLPLFPTALLPTRALLKLLP